MSRIITLPTTETIVVKEAETVTTDEVTLSYFVDNGVSATAEIKFPNVEYAKQYVLWDATTTPTYEDAGQYTDTDINNRIIELM